MFIGSCGYSGSTLLDLILGADTNAVSLGEIYKLAWYSQSPVARCTCGEPIVACRFWSDVLAELRARKQDPALEFSEVYLTVKRAFDSPHRFIPRLLDLLLVLGNRSLLEVGAAISSETRDFRQAARSAYELFECVSTVAEAEYVIDSSKDPTLLKILYLHAPDRCKIIHLVRDGRAVAYSFLKNEARDGRTLPETASDEERFLEGTRWWVSKNRNLEWVLKSIPSKRVFFLRYEDLCRDPDAVVGQLGRFLGTALTLKGGAIEKTAYHNISGNPMRFRRDETSIQLREEWKEKLSPGDLEIFSSVGGALNRRLGYPDSF